MDSKRALDVVASGAGLVIAGPLMGGVAIAIWLHDRGNPIYAAKRCGRFGRNFTMLKFRTMVLDAERFGASSTGNRDPRITPVGHLIRAVKVDELPQLVNVLRGDMSLVGPRPNIDWAVASYSDEERELLSARPGITDLASIVFADEGEILADAKDPDLSYEQLIRPWKSRLGLLYVRHASAILNLKIIALTLLNAVDRPATLRRVSRIVHTLGGSPRLVAVSLRDEALTPAAPPGFSAPISQVAK